MLITKEVEVNLIGIVFEYYKNLGYEIPTHIDKRGRKCYTNNSKIIVKVTDLKPSSTIKVDVTCDCCGKQYDLRYADYMKCNRNGKVYCQACSLALFNSGENNPSYKADKTDEERERGRCYPEYTKFIKKVLIRDKYTCQCCGKERKDMEVHHLDSYDWCKEKRTDETNGITLCTNCHSNFHSIYGRGNNTKDQYEKWIGHVIGDLKKYNGKLPTTRKVYCLEDNILYNSIEEITRKHNVSRTRVSGVCNHVYTHTKGFHFLWEEEYKQSTKEELEFLKSLTPKPISKKVVCITTGELFDMMTYASNKYGLKSVTSITNVCNGKKKSAGKLSDGTPLKWMYYEDFLKLSQEEQNEILSRNQESSNDGSFIM